MDVAVAKDVAKDFICCIACSHDDQATSANTYTALVTCIFHVLSYVSYV